MPAVQARHAPDPLPSFSSLPRIANKVLYSSGNLRGVRIIANGEEVYVWDIEFAQASSGELLVLSWELQSASDYADETRLLPPGAALISDLRHVFGADQLAFTDPSGVLFTIDIQSVQAGGINSEGVIVDPNLGGACKAGRSWSCVPSYFCQSGCPPILHCGCGEEIGGFEWVGWCKWVPDPPGCFGSCTSPQACLSSPTGCKCQ